MFRKKLCPTCSKGKETYDKDARSPVCPYLECHNGKECPLYEPLPKKKNDNGIKKLLLRIKNQ